MSDYQIWAVAGLILIIAELFTPSFFIIFFGVGSIVTAATTYMGLTTGITSQLIVFSISSIILLLLFRRRLKLKADGDTPTLPPDFIGQRVKVSKTILPGEEGQVSYRGSAWIAFSDSGEAIKEGSLVEIIGNDGVRLKVKPLF